MLNEINTIKAYAIPDVVFEPAVRKLHLHVQNVEASTENGSSLP